MAEDRCDGCGRLHGPGPQGVKFLSLFDINASGPLSDQELKDVQRAAFAFMLDNDHKGTLAHLIMRLAGEVSDRRNKQ